MYLNKNTFYMIWRYGTTSAGAS